ncbi:MAG: hypothetical protein Q9218_001219 [Villophora microphyllina]
MDVILDADNESPKQNKKRRKTVRGRHDSDTAEYSNTVPLLYGKEIQQYVRQRANSLYTVWQPQEDLIDEISNKANTGTSEEIAKFVQQSSRIGSEAAIPSALVVVGPNSSPFANVVRSVTSSLGSEDKAIVISIAPSQIGNLKAALKLINSYATSPGSYSEPGVLTSHQYGRHLNYDLQILCDHVNTHAIDEVVLAFQDSEAFDGPLLCELIEVISLWMNRIPFVLLFAIKTSIEFFQEKLSQAAIRHLQGVQFEVAHIEVDNIFRAYAHMTFFFANPLSILLADSASSGPLQAELYECVRNLESFRFFAERLLEQSDVDKARHMLNDDAFLHAEIMKGITQGKETLHNLIGAVETLQSIQENLRLKNNESWSTLYMKAMAGELQGSALVRDTLFAIRKSPSDAMASLLDSLSDALPEASVLTEELRWLESTNGSKGPLRSEHDTHPESLRTTIVAQRVELSKHSLSLSRQDLVYSKLVNRVEEAFSNYFDRNLLNPQELFLHEILVLDLKSPHREVFAPKPRYATERALSSPRDYLGCSCCKGAQHGLSATNPATSILYQLYLESGAIINISDLWSAFYTIVGTENEDEEDAEQERAL